MACYRSIHLECVDMSVLAYSRKCTSCGGNKWEYLKDSKVWRCQYCYGQVVRQEQYDGLYTIKNVVRQVVLDCAYRKMEQADRNLSECQKINASYTGTLIAGICCRMIAVVSGIYMAGQDAASLRGQIRRDYMKLIAQTRDLTDDETALYEFMDSSDAWAILAVVFDSLGDEQRREYLLTLVEPGQVFSKETNKSLLRLALKHNRLDLAEHILSNRENVDIADAIRIIFTACPDGESKMRMGAGLISAGAIKPGEESVLEDYLSGADSNETKVALVHAACNVGLVLHLDVLLREILPHAELPVFEQILGSLFKRRLYDGEIEMLLSFAAAQKEGERGLAVINAIAASGQFVALNLRQIKEFLFASTEAVFRTEIMKKLRNFSAADRIWENVTGSYLYQGDETVENRTLLLDVLYESISSVPAKDFEQYVLMCSVDGAIKVERIRRIMSLPNMNVGFFRELAGKYLKDNKDAPEHRRAVLHQMIECGIAVDGATLMNYICNAEDADDEKAELVQLAMKNGTALRADALSIYLEQCADRFSPELFALLYTGSGSVTQKAIENYVLHCKDSPAVKVQNASALARNTGLSLGSGSCTLLHQGKSLRCSLAQAYLLTTDDDVSVASRMLTAMTESGTKLTTVIQVNHMPKKFSKYVQEMRSQLSPVAEQLCQEHRLFSWFLLG